MSTLLTAVVIICSCVISVIVGHYAARQPWWGQWWYATWAVASVVLSALLAARGEWLLSAWLAFCALANGWQWWNCRKNRKRKRAAALMGAKSRARIQALVRKAREAARPRRVLRPVPGGAR